MPESVFPEHIIRGLNDLGGLPDDTFNAFFKAIGETAPTIKTSELISRIAQTISAKKSDNNAVESILASLFNLAAAKYQFGKSIDEILTDIDREGEIPTKVKETLRRRVPKALLAPFIVVSSKAVNIIMSHEKVFVNARILSDIRPIFNDEKPGEKPSGAVLVHMLKITYQMNDTTKEAFFAMDTKDVADLKNVLVRAEAKAASIKGVLKDSGIPYLEAPHEPSNG